MSALEALAAARGALSDASDLYVDANTKVAYTALNDVAVVDFARSQLSYSDFERFLKQEYADATFFDLAQMRGALVTFTRNLLFVPHRTPDTGIKVKYHHWTYFSEVLAQKAVKDVLIRDYIRVVGEQGAEKISLQDAKRLFFDPLGRAEEAKLLVYINSILVQMQAFVLNGLRRGIQSGSLKPYMFDLEKRVFGERYSIEEIFMAPEGSSVWTET